jgi:membrane-bound serine protease (ClpP class)
LGRFQGPRQIILAVRVRALYRPSTTGAAGMVGQFGFVKTTLDPEGQILVDGELWRAVTRDGPLPGRRAWRF